MKGIFLIPLFFAVASCTQTAGSSDPKGNSSAAEKGDVVKAYNTTELPKYPAGFQGLYEHIDKNMRYPSEAKNQGIEGRVFVEVIISKDGDVMKAKVVKGLGHGLDDEALRLVNSFPKQFIPGLRENEIVNTKTIVPIVFDIVEYLRRTEGIS